MSIEADSLRSDSLRPGTTRPQHAVLPATFPVVAGADHRRAQERGHAEGHAAGYAAGMRRAEAAAVEDRRRMQAEHDALLERLRVEAESTLSRQVSALAAATQALERRTAPVLAEGERALADCALALAQAVLGTALDDAESRVRAALTRVLGHSSDRLPVRVRLHPADLAVLEQLRAQGEQLTPAGPALDRLDFVADATLTPGDAMADYPDGFLDARLGAALDRARVALLDPAPGCEPAIVNHLGVDS